MPIRSHVDEASVSKPVLAEPSKEFTPRRVPQLATLERMPLQPSGMGTHVSAPVVDGNTRNDCGGVPTLIENVDHLPSSPSQLHEGETEKGAGTAETLIVSTT